MQIFVITIVRGVLAECEMGEGSEAKETGFSCGGETRGRKVEITAILDRGA